MKVLEPSLSDEHLAQLERDTFKYFADEINLYVDWTPNDNLWLGALYGAALPGDAAEEAFGDDDPFHAPRPPQAATRRSRSAAPDKRSRRSSAPRRPRTGR